MSLILSKDELVGVDFDERQAGWGRTEEMVLNAHCNMRFVLDGYPRQYNELLAPIREQLDFLDDILSEIIHKRHGNN